MLARKGMKAKQLAEQIGSEPRLGAGSGTTRIFFTGLTLLRRLTSLL